MNTKILFNKNMLPAQFETSSNQLIVICTHSGHCTFQMCTTSEEMSRSATNGMVCILHSPEGVASYERAKREYTFLCKAFVATHKYGEENSPGILTVDNINVIVSVKKHTVLARIRNRVVKEWRRLCRNPRMLDYGIEVWAATSHPYKLLKVGPLKTKAEDILLHFGFLPRI